MSTNSQRQIPRGYRLGAVAAAILLLAGSFVGALRTPGAIGLIGYGVAAVAAAVVGFALSIASRHNRGYQSTHTTSLAAGLFVLAPVIDVLMIVASAVLREQDRVLDFRFGVMLVNVLLALVIAAIGIFGAVRGQRSDRHVAPPSPEQARARIAEIDDLANAEHAMAEGEATPEQQAAVLDDAQRRAREHRDRSWARALRDSPDQ